MKTVPIELAEQLEQAEAMAWRDMVNAAPLPFIQKTGLSIDLINDNTCLSCPAIPFVHFNCVLGFGTHKKITASELDQLIDHYQKKRAPLYLFAVQGLHEYLEPMLSERGFVPAGRWERLFRDNRSLDGLVYRIPRKWSVIKLSVGHLEEWAAFISTAYGLPIIREWLLSFAIRENWFHYLLVEEGEIIAVRSFFKGADGFAFSGMEAPIPGVTTSNYQMDMSLMYYLIKDALKMGVKRFIADIELVDERGETPAYANAKALGFMIPYRRLVYKRLNKG